MNLVGATEPIVNDHVQSNIDLVRQVPSYCRWYLNTGSVQYLKLHYESSRDNLRHLVLVTQVVESRF